MGFCLLESVGMDGFYYAVNSSHIEDVMPQRETPDGHPSCLLKFSFTPKGFRPCVLGTRLAVQDILMQAAKIGVQNVEASTFVGRGKKLQPTPLLVKRSDRVVIARELPQEEFLMAGISSPTASEILMEDGKMHVIAERPGVFATRANAAGKVPVLRVR